MINISYILLLDAINNFAEPHLGIGKFGSDFPTQMPNFGNSSEAYPILFVSPTNTIFDLNTKTFKVDVYALDIIQKNRENINTVLSDTSLILSDFDRWFRDGKIPGIDLTEVSPAEPINNALLDWAAGWVMHCTFEVNSYGICEIPFAYEPTIATVVNDIVYQSYLTCNTLSSCDTITGITNDIIVLQNEVIALSANTGSQTLQSVTDYGNTTTNAINVDRVVLYDDANDAYNGLLSFGDGTFSINDSLSGSDIFKVQQNSLSLINYNSFSTFLSNSNVIYDNVIFDFPNVPNTGTYKLLISDDLIGYITDAPNDGNVYGRKNGDWSGINYPTDIHTTGFTFNPSTYDLTIKESNGTNFTQNLGILATDINVTGGTYNINTGIVTFKNNLGGTFNVTGFTSGMTDTYTTGGTYSNGTTTFTKSNGSSYSVSGFSTPQLSAVTYDAYTGPRLNPIDSSINGFGLTKSINGAIGINIQNTSTGNGAYAAFGVGGDSSPYIKSASLIYYGSGYYRSELQNTAGIYNEVPFSIVSLNNTNIQFKTGNAFGTETNKLSISSGGTINIGTTPLTNNTGSLVGRNSSGDLVLIDKDAITSGITSTYVPYSGANGDVNINTNNFYGNTYFNGFTTITASTASTLTLTIRSTPVYLVTGSGGQTIQLPNATTLPNGSVYSFNNNQSSGVINVNNNSGTLVKSVASGAYLTLELIDNTTPTGLWDAHFETPSNANWSTNTLDWNGSIINATWNGTVVQPNRGGSGQSTYTNGQILIGNSGNTLTKATLTAGNNINITNGNGSITIGGNNTYITGGTYSNGTATFTNNSGNTFNVTGFNTGYTLTSTAITSTLGYTPYSSTNPNQYISGITFNNVTTALGYTPLSAFTDTYVTGGTYTAGTATFVNTTGGTFNVTGFANGFGSNPGLEMWSVDYGSAGFLYFDTQTRVYGSTQLYNDGGIWTNTTSNTLSFNITASVLWVGDGNPYENINTLSIVHSNLGYINADSIATNFSYSLTDGYASSVSSDIILEPGEYFYLLGGSRINNVNVPANFIDGRLEIASLFVGEQGPQGISGNTGPSNVLSIGTVVSGVTASATISGTSPSQVLNLVLPQGPQGQMGPSGTFTGGTVTGSTTFINGLIANTFSATTYQNLPTDVRVTGGTYSAGTTIFTNNTGGTFSVSGFSTGYTLTSTGINTALGYTPLSAYTDTFTTGGTYSNGTTVFTNNTGGTFTVTGFTIPFTGGTVTGSTTFTNGLSATTINGAAPITLQQVMRAAFLI